MTTTQLGLVAVAAILIAATVSATRSALATLRPQSRLTALAAAGTIAAVLALRVALVTPSFIHANLHGAGLVDDILSFPAPAKYRATFGQFSFLALGAAAALLGRRFEVIVACNQVLGVGALALMGVAARRWTGRTSALFLVLALGALHPALLRVAASEDAHTLALLLAWTAVVALDKWAESRRAADLTLAVAALILVIHTRQTFYGWIPIPFALAIARDRTVLHDKRFRVAAATAAAALAARMLATVFNSSEQISFIMMPILLSSWRSVGNMLRYHPLLDVARFGLFVPLGLCAGFVFCMCRRGPLRMLALATLGFLMFTLCFSTSTPGVEFSFRTPVTSLGLVVAGIGIDAFFAWTRLRPSLVALACCLLALAPLATRGFAITRLRTTDFAEYAYVRALVPLLPKKIALVTIPWHEPMPSYRPPRDLLRAAGVTANYIEPSQLSLRHPPAYFIAGVACWAYALHERDDDKIHGPFQIPRAMLAAIFEHIIARDIDARHAAPLTMRPECVRLLKGATLIAPPIEIMAVQDVPFATYGLDRIPIGIYRLRADARLLPLSFGTRAQIPRTAAND